MFGAPVPELCAQTRDVGIHRARVAVIILAPNIVKQLFAVIDSSDVGKQFDQNIVFL